MIDGTRAVTVHRTRNSGLLVGAAMDHEIDGPAGDGHRRRELPRRQPVHRRQPTRPRRAPPPREVPRVRVVVASVTLGGARPGRRRAGGRDAHRLGGPARRPARPARRVLGRRRRRGRRRSRGAAGRAVRAVLRVPGQRPRRAPADPGQGAHRSRATTATPSGTPRRFVLPVLVYTEPAAAADALRWRARLHPAGHRARASRSASTAPPSRGARSAAVSARATGPPAPPPST